ncbi:nucleotide-diphospho-sugar transferase [Trichodelitschia bisporula]|uniref:Nucleotide-diphospho-sugar transferase n=1 Tax=Trichodelitschia bisporula TaxID=703511 RepID=A0A6G1HWA8_9PEZI|nr:nucleotide-diphospho-sugar transferase [Trichodelitschia bisporula]
MSELELNLPPPTKTRPCSVSDKILIATLDQRFGLQKGEAKIQEDVTTCDDEGGNLDPDKPNVHFNDLGHNSTIDAGCNFAPGAVIDVDDVNIESTSIPNGDLQNNTSVIYGADTDNIEGWATENNAVEGRTDQSDSDRGIVGEFNSTQAKLGNLSRLWHWLRCSYAPKESPMRILPSAPSDEEKYFYLHTNRIPLYVVGIFAFLSLSAGMWLFVSCSYVFLWFSIVAVFLQIYLFISYLVGVVGRDWDLQSHQDALKAHPVTLKTAPTVDIYLPCCREPLEILENTYRQVVKLKYPPDRLRVFVMDDGNLASVKALASQYGFSYFVRDNRPRLRKAGNLRWTFARTTGEFFAIFDADFCPRSDFLLELIPEHLADEETAIVQSPQFFRVSTEQTWVEQGAGAVQELFYRVVQVNRNRWGAAICVGSNAVYRRTALEAVGGTAEIGFSEDVHTGFGAVDRGWKVKYIPLCLACGLCPDTPRAFFSQQMRWCMGSTTLLTSPAFWKSGLTAMQKVCYACGFLYYSAVALSIFMSSIPGIFLLWLRPDLFYFYNLSFAIPSIVYGAILLPLWARSRYGCNVQHIMVIQSFAYLHALVDKITGSGLQWIPSGDAKAPRSNKYRNMRAVAWLWWIAVVGGMASVVTWRVAHSFHWYHTMPLILLNAYNLYLAHPFLLYSGG